MKTLARTFFRIASPRGHRTPAPISPGPPGALIADRALETTIGAVIAFFIILVTTRRQRARERESSLPSAH